MLDLRLALPDEERYMAAGDLPVKVRCREHTDRHPSLNVYPDHLHCYGKCGLHLSGEAALRYLLKQEDVDVAHYTNEALDAYRQRAAEEAKRTPLPEALAVAYHKLLLNMRVERLEWLHARGLTDETIHVHALGHDGFRFTIPVYDADGNLVTIRLRRDDEYGLHRPKYMGMAGRNGLYLFPEDVLSREENHDFDSLIVCEGELDALRLWQDDLPAVTVTNGAGQIAKLPALVKQAFPWVTELQFATDQDEAGCEAARLGMAEARTLGFETGRVVWPLEEGKDVTEFYARGHSYRDWHIER
jgi:DNA primase